MASHPPPLSLSQAAALRRAERRRVLRALLHDHARDAALRRARRRHLARAQQCADEGKARAALIVEETAAWVDVSVPSDVVRAGDPPADPVAERWIRRYAAVLGSEEQDRNALEQQWACDVRAAASVPLLVCAEDRLRKGCAASEAEQWRLLCAEGVAWVKKAQRLARAAVADEESRERVDAQQLGVVAFSYEVGVCMRLRHPLQSLRRWQRWPGWWFHAAWVRADRERRRLAKLSAAACVLAVSARLG
eukprot:gene19147-47404_t